MRWATRREQLRHWTQMVLGRSYWESALGLGRGFRPRELGDYYRDYSSKVAWRGALDDRGLPLIQEPGAALFHHPLVLAQKALGHWSRWLASGRSDDAHRADFLDLAAALLGRQLASGGWTIRNMQRSVYATPFSAMAQGQAASVLVRAWSVTADRGYLEAARRGLELMLVPIDAGGPARAAAGGLVLEEYPGERLNAVLNGWVSALFGLYDYGLVEQRADLCSALARTVSALAALAPRYDAGYWSHYDLRGALASPYYHLVHISQLRALELCFAEHASAFAAVRTRFELQQASTTCRTRAFVVKAAQKLRQSQTTVVVQPRSSAKSGPGR